MVSQTSNMLTISRFFLAIIDSRTFIDDGELISLWGVVLLISNNFSFVDYLFVNHSGRYGATHKSDSGAVGLAMYRSHKSEVISD
jgi:hypothetical protein